MMNHLSVYFPAGLRDALDRFAEEHGYNRSEAMRLAARRLLNAPEPYIAPTLPNWQAESWTALLRGLFGDERLVLTDDTRMLLRQAVAALDSRQAQVLRLRFGLDGPRHTLKDVAAIMGWADRQRVYQVEVEALRRVRGWCRVRGIWDLLREQLDGEEA